MSSISSLPSPLFSHQTRTIRSPDSNSNPKKLKFSRKIQSLENQISSLLQSCSSFAQLAQIHAQIIRNSLHQNHFLASKLISSYFSLGFHSHASLIFSQILSPDIFLFNAMIKGFVSSALHRKVLHFYCIILNESEFSPTNFTFPLLLKSCSKLLLINEGKTLHGHVLKLGHGADIFIQTALVDLYGSCCYSFDARKVFDRLPEPDVVAWNAMVSACMKSGFVLLAEEVFDEMPVKNLKSWTMMIGGFLNAGDPERALSTFRQMQVRGFMPDEMAIATILSAIADLGCLSSGEWVHEYIKMNAIQIDAYIGTALIDMYSKSGNIQNAKLVFSSMKSRNTSCYNAMIFGLGIHGLGVEAISVFDELKESKLGIDDVTMIAILTACSHSGLVEEGLRLFKVMIEDYDVNPMIKHYGCVVDLLGRAGRFAEAKLFVDSIKVDSVVLGALGAACRKHGNTELADELCVRITDLDSEFGGFLIWRAHLHAAKNEWKDAARVRMLMKEKGIEKGAGCSWIELGEKLNWFVAGDHSHPCSNEIYCKLDELYDVMKTLEMEG